MFKLVISDDEGKPTVVPLVRDEVSIGRAEGNTIRLTDRNVSRQHAVLVKEGARYSIRDLDSYNGTFVDGTKVEESAPVPAGAKIGIGDYQIALHVDSSDAVADPAAGGSASPEDAGPPARLVMLTLPVPGAEFALSGAHMRLGRSEDLDIWINHRSISREHAEIIRDEDGCYRIVDMGSANGVRVNGDEVEESDLEPYDVIKLGRVRLRYVPAGEAYIFDPAAESVDEDDATPDEGGSRAPLWMAIGVVAIAALVGGAIIIHSGTPAVEADSAREGPAPEPLADGPAEPEPVAAEPEPTPEESLEACREALKDAKWQDAVDHAEAVLQVRPDDAEAAECRTAGRSGVVFHQGYEAFQEGAFEEAYAAYSEIPEGNPFRQHPSIAETVARLAEDRLERARQALDEDLEFAGQLAQDVLDMEGVSKSAITQAKRILRSVQVRSRRSGFRPSKKAGGQRTKEEGATEGGAGAGGATPFDEALACASKGDNACVVKSLEGRATTPRALALLIETYRAMGNADAAARNMRLFVSRYPSDRRASRYEQFLENQ
jgi:ABC transport system ATP-binding/permease protein